MKWFPVFFLIILSLSVYAQNPKKNAPLNWKVSGSFSPDFFPFSFNEVKNYRTSWDLNFTYGVMLSGKLSEKAFLGVGLMGSTKSHTQNFSCETCPTFDFTPFRLRSKVRYVEIPVVYEKIIIGEPELSNVSFMGGITTALLNKATTDAFLGPQNDTVSSPVNDFYFARFLFGVNFGVGFNLFFTEEVSLGIHPHMKLYATDIYNENFLNMSSVGFLFRLSYHFE